ncbi:MAG: hypothetical protein HZB41_01320 [Ignavibacteriae bacterium]|nr:hypothetical protein [Ignavibacteriota bacterium]
MYYSKEISLIENEEDPSTTYRVTIIKSEEDPSTTLRVTIIKSEEDPSTTLRVTIELLPTITKKKSLMPKNV